VLSLYDYWREVAPAGNGRGPELAKTHSLDAFLDLTVAAVVADVHNAQTWQIAFAHDGHTRNSVLAEGDLEMVYKQAVANLEQVDVVGVQEDLPRFMQALSQRFGWKLTSPRPVNVTDKRRQRADIPLATLKKIHNLVEADIELYARARSLAQVDG
jgi:hypothetical protein